MQPDDPVPLRVTLLRVEGFRNLSGVEVLPGPGINVFVGDNGQGKTSLLEAVDYVATLRSFRGAARSVLVGHGRPFAEALLQVESVGLSRLFRVRIDRKTRAFSLDGKRPERAVHYYGAAACVAFQPQDLELIRGAPEERRRLLDRILLRAVDGYGEAVRVYTKALRSRNAILRDPAPDVRAVHAYDTLLAKAGSAIVRARSRVAEELLPATRSAAQEVALTEVELGVSYRTKAPTGEKEYLEALRTAWPTDLQRKSTTMGPHADDLGITWGKAAARLVASQGQTRALALALRLAELHVLRSRSGRVPWLLLDDVSSELDRERTKRLFALVAALKAQVWVTTTDRAVLDLLPDARVWSVQNGAVFEEA